MHGHRSWGNRHNGELDGAIGSEVGAVETERAPLDHPEGDVVDGTDRRAAGCRRRQPKLLYQRPHLDGGDPLQGCGPTPARDQRGPAEAGRAPDQPAGLRVLRVVEHLGGRTGLDHDPIREHDDALSPVGRDAEVMGDEDDSDAVLRGEPATSPT